MMRIILFACLLIASTSLAKKPEKSCENALVSKGYKKSLIDHYRPEEPVFTSEEVDELECAFQDLIDSGVGFGDGNLWTRSEDLGWATFFIPKILKSKKKSKPIKFIQKMAKKCKAHIKSLNLFRRHGLALKNAYGLIFRYQFDHANTGFGWHKDGVPTLIHFMKGKTTGVRDPEEKIRVGDTILIHGRAEHKVPKTKNKTRIYCFARWYY